MSLHSDRSGEPSRIFGKRYPYPLDGKALLFEILEAFVAEFNQQAKLEIVKFGSDRVAEWQPLTVVSAFPTIRQDCPRIVVRRVSSSPKLAGLGGEIETIRLSNTQTVRAIRGQDVTDTIEISICTMNENLCDDLFLWVQQYLFDALYWLLPQLNHVTDARCINAVDDIVEYEGTRSQPGFQFYVAQLTYQVLYQMLVLENVDIIKSIFNWQNVAYANQPSIVGTVQFELPIDEQS